MDASNRLVIRSDQRAMNHLFAQTQNKLIIKPRLQRKLQWCRNKTTQNDPKLPTFERYIQFLANMRNSILPLVLVEVEPNQRYSIIDGNNRVNAIYAFMSAPLSVTDEQFAAFMSPTTNISVNRIYAEILHVLSFDDITRNLFSRLLFKRAMPETVEKFIMRELNINDASLIMNTIRTLFEPFMTLLDDAFSSLSDELQKFIQPNNVMINVVTVPLVQLSSQDIIAYIYESINGNGVTLSQEDLLAATLSTITYTRDELSPAIFDQLSAEINVYYTDGNANETLSYDDYYDKNRLNLFEILMAHNRILFSTIAVSFVGKLQSRAQNIGSKNICGIIFKIYENLSGYGFEKIRLTRAYHTPDRVLQFLHMMLQCFTIIRDIGYDVYTSGENDTTQTFMLTTSNLEILVIYIMEMLVNNTLDMRRVKLAIIYNEFAKYTPAKIKEDVPQDINSSRSILQQFANGNPLESGKKFTTICTDIKTLGVDFINFDKCISALEILYNTVCDIVNADGQKIIKSAYERFVRLVLSVFHNMRCSDAHRPCSCINQIDHIVPKSSRCDNISLLRLGNLCKINAGVNSKKSNRQYDTIFYTQNRLGSFDYPDTNKYFEIVHRNGLYVNKDRFHAMCISREQSMWIEIRRYILNGVTRV